MTRCRSLLFALAALIALPLFATSFIVPTDDELIAKSDRILVGTVEGSFVQEKDGTIETVYEIRVDEALKGGLARGQLQRVVSLGGVLGGRGLLVPASARYTQGERVLIFLTRDEGGTWRTTEMTLGRFEFVTSTRGERLLVRDMEDVVGWNHAGQEHREKLRREAGFLHWVRERAGGRQAGANYLLEASEATFSSKTVQGDAVLTPEANAPAFPAPTYTDYVSNQPIRWASMSSGVNFYKRSDQNIANAADGGVSAIQSGLAAWNNEPNSNINMVYAGQRATASANHDGVNVVEYNDPQSRISGSWTGSGTVGVTFLSFAGSHSFAGVTWWNITDADVVFQNGYTATSSGFAPAMTHELGHAIGFRHSNQDYATGGACNSATQECTSAAIMNSSVSGSYGYTLQPWDQNAAQAVYPGASTCSAPSIAAQPTSRSITSGESTTLTVTATGTGTLSYQWYVGSSGNTNSPINGANAASLTVSPTTTTSYWVRISNSCGAVNSSTATVTVSTACTPAFITTQPISRTITAGTTTSLSVGPGGTGPVSYQWFTGASGNTAAPISGATSATLTVTPTTTTSYWARVSNACGSANSAAATVTVTAACTAPTITTQPTSRTITAGATTSLSVGPGGTGPISYQWYTGASGNAAAPISGATSATLTVSPTTTTSYWARVTNACGSANSVSATVTVTGGTSGGGGIGDLLWRNTSTGVGQIWVMNANATVARTASLPHVTDLNFQMEAVGDFDRDGDPDVAWRNYATGQNTIWQMQGTTNVSFNYLPTLADLNWKMRAAGDFDGDGDADILWRNLSTGAVMVWIVENRAHVNTVNLPSVTDLNWDIAATGDMDLDGDVDVIWRNYSTGANSIWVMNRLVYNGVISLPAVALPWRIQGAHDMDGDGDVDVVWRNPNTGQNSYWQMNRTTYIQAIPLPSLTGSWQIEGVANFG